MCYKNFFLKFHNGYFEGLHTTMEITKYVAKMNSFNKMLRCENHRKEVINMACKKCYRYNCLQCDEECTTTTCNGKYLYSLRLQTGATDAKLKFVDDLF